MSPYPDIKIKLYSIDKAISFHLLLGEKLKAAQSYVLKSSLEQLIKNRTNESFSTKFKAGVLFLEANENDSARSIFQSIIKSKVKDIDILDKSKIAFYLSNSQNIQGSISKADDSILSYLKSSKVHDVQFLSKSILKLNEYDKIDFLNERKNIYTEYNKKTLDKMYKVFLRLEKRSSYLKSYPLDNNLLARTYSSLGVLSDYFSETYNYLYYNYKKNDIFLSYSSRYNTASKNYFSNAISVNDLDEKTKILIYMEAKKYFKIPGDLISKLLFIDEEKSHLNSDNHVSFRN